MKDLDILLSRRRSNEEKLDAFNRLIESNNLYSPDTHKPLITLEEVDKAFTFAYENEYAKSYCRGYYFLEHADLFDTLLNTNKNMFVAVIKSIVRGKRDWDLYFSLLVKNNDNTFSIGWNPKIITNNRYAHTFIVPFYESLIDRCEFPVDNLILPEKDKQEIQNYSVWMHHNELTPQIGD